MTARDRGDALTQIVELADRFGIGAEEILSALHAAPQETSTASNLLVKVLSYIGGIFVLAGIATFIALQWESMNSLARVIITLGVGVAVFTLAMVAMSDERYQRLATPLLLISGLLQPTGMMVAFAEYGTGGDERVAALITAATFGIQYGMCFLKWRATVMAWFMVFFTSAAWGFALDLADQHEDLIAITLGIAWLCLGVATLRGAHAALSAQLFLIGCWAFLAGLFDTVEGTVFESIFVLATCGLIYLGVWAKSRALNIASAIALLAYTTYFTSRYFADSTGWPIALIIIGLTMIAISAVALRIDRQYIRQT